MNTNLANSNSFHDFDFVHSTSSTASHQNANYSSIETLRVNPEPLSRDESQMLMEEYLSSHKLREISCHTDLSKVTELTLQVDATETSLGNFGQHLPNLTALRLDDCVIPSLRDLGSSLNSLHTLWIQRSCLEELDGISSMVHLVELFFSYNAITDLSPLGMCENLEVLDAEGNNITEIGQILFLSTCCRLSRLTLEGNPVCLLPEPNSSRTDYHYRNEVRILLPKLLYLDDKLLQENSDTTKQSPETTKQSPATLETDWAYLDELKNDELLDKTLTTLDEQSDSINDILLSSPSRIGSASRPSSSIRPITTRQVATRSGLPDLSRPTFSARPWTSLSTPKTALSHTTQDLPDTLDDSSSPLTSGDIVCGHPAKALLARRKVPFTPPANDAIDFLNTFGKSENEDIVTPKPKTEENDDEQLMEELKNWREHHEVILQRIAEEKAPQILKITPGELASESDTDTSDDEENIEFSPMYPKSELFPCNTFDNLQNVPSTELAPVKTKVQDYRTRKYASHLNPNATGFNTARHLTRKEVPSPLPHIKADESFDLDPPSPERGDQACSPDSGFSSAISPIGSGSDGHADVLVRTGRIGHQPVSPKVTDNFSVTSVTPSKTHTLSPLKKHSIHSYPQQTIPKSYKNINIPNISH